MFHARFMPSSARKCEGLRSAFGAIAILICIGLPSASHAAELPRLASINLCTDQLLVTLADPAQILGLSPYSRDLARSWDAAKAAQFPKLSGEAEDVLVLKPDIVVAGRFTKRATRELLKEKGLRVVEFDAALSLDDVKKQIRLMGDLVQHPDRAAAEIKRLDAAIAHAREVVSRKPYRVLALSRRGWVSGGDSLISSLLATAGLSNAAADLGYKFGGFASLEAIVSLRPDFLLVSEAGDFAEDEGRAFMLHPALERYYPAVEAPRDPGKAHRMRRAATGGSARIASPRSSSAWRIEMLISGDTLFVVVAALAFDALIGDPDWLWRRLSHPVVLIGSSIGFLDRALNRETWSPRATKISRRRGRHPAAGRFRMRSDC